MNDVTITPIKNGDALILYDLIESNRWHLKQNFPVTSQSIISLESSADFIKKKIEDFNNKEEFFFIISVNKKQAGIITIKNIDWRTPKAEIAYFVDEKLQGKGIATNAIEQIINFGFFTLDFQKLFACVNPDNISSRKVLLKNNFQLEGLLKSNFLDGFGNLVDSEYYGLLKINV